MPDLIAITGDLLSSGRGEPELRRAINALEARHGVLAILGNHEVDVTRDPFSRAPEPGAFPGDGAELLRDSAVSFDVGRVSRARGGPRLGELLGTGELPRPAVRRNG